MIEQRRNNWQFFALTWLIFIGAVTFIIINEAGIEQVFTWLTGLIATIWLMVKYLAT